jgi:hypothetical protein
MQRVVSINLKGLVRPECAQTAVQHCLAARVPLPGSPGSLCHLQFTSRIHLKAALGLNMNGA